MNDHPQQIHAEPCYLDSADALRLLEYRFHFLLAIPHEAAICSWRFMTI